MSRPAPGAKKQLKVGYWTCAACGASHDRDVFTRASSSERPETPRMSVAMQSSLIPVSSSALCSRLAFPGTLLFPGQASATPGPDRSAAGAGRSIPSSFLATSLPSSTLPAWSTPGRSIPSACVPSSTLLGAVNSAVALRGGSPVAAAGLGVSASSGLAATTTADPRIACVERSLNLDRFSDLRFTKRSGTSPRVRRQWRER